MRYPQNLADALLVLKARGMVTKRIVIAVRSALRQIGAEYRG